MLKKLISMLLMLSFALLLAGESLQDLRSDPAAAEGSRDGKEDASPWWVLSGAAGVGAGLFFFADRLLLAGSSCALGAIAPWFFPGKVPAEKLIGKPAAYAQAYGKAYLDAKRGRQVLYSGTAVASGLLGMALGVFLALVLPGIEID